MTRRSGFTLVELVVVILILGILAGVAAPKMFNTSGNATDSGLKQTLSIVRDAIELYAAQNAGAMPPCTSPGNDFKSALSMYIRGPFPKCPVGPSKTDTVTPDGAPSATPSTGWNFDTTSGAFTCAYNGPSNDGATTYDKF
ncbi:MAG: type II secretion system protein [Pirellulales bacterium]|nr:type II secretion system protein [Pirellulales bacterium]